MTPIDRHWIVGPGALGRLIGLHLATGPQGQGDVTLLGRRRLPTRQTLVTPEGDPMPRTLAVAELNAPPRRAPDLVHLTTKAYAAEAAHAAIATVLPEGTPLVLWQNGFDCQPRLTERHAGPVLCATTTEGAYVESDSRVVHAGRGETLIGALDGRHTELANALAALLSDAGLAARAVGDIRQRLWQKLAVNAAINPLVARFRIRNGQLRDRPFRPMVEAIIIEVAAILTAEGIAPPGMAGTDTGGKPQAAALEGWHALVWGVVDGTANNRASMLQDVLAGRPTEYRAILGPLLASAAHHGLAAPRLTALEAELCRQARDLADSDAPC